MNEAGGSVHPTFSWCSISSTKSDQNKKYKCAGDQTHTWNEIWCWFLFVSSVLFVSDPNSSVTIPSEAHWWFNTWSSWKTQQWLEGASQRGAGKLPPAAWNRPQIASAARKLSVSHCCRCCHSLSPLSFIFKHFITLSGEPCQSKYTKPYFFPPKVWLKIPTILDFKLNIKKWTLRKWDFVTI